MVIAMEVGGYVVDDVWRAVVRRIVDLEIWWQVLKPRFKNGVVRSEFGILSPVYPRLLQPYVKQVRFLHAFYSS